MVIIIVSHIFLEETKGMNTATLRYAVLTTGQPELGKHRTPMIIEKCKLETENWKLPVILATWEPE